MRYFRWTAAVVAGLIGGSALADVEVYRGQDPEGKEIAVTAIGTGQVEASTDVVLVGTRSLKITSRGRFQGARVNFATPVDLSSAATDGSNLLTFSVLSADRASGSMGGGQAVRPMRYLRVVIATDDGKRTELEIPFVPKSGSATWHRMGVPLSAFPGFAQTSRKVQSIQFGSDVPATFYVGEIRVVNDATPISAEAFLNEGSKEIYIANNDVALLWAVAEAGSSVLKYSWDFDDKDGIQDEAEGVAVEHTFRKPGAYTVTLTVSDRWGSKKPVTATVKVNVAM